MLPRSLFIDQVDCAKFKDEYVAEDLEVKTLLIEIARVSEKFF